MFQDFRRAIDLREKGRASVTESDPFDLIAVARQIVTAVDRHDLEALHPLYHNDLVEDVPMVGRIEGIDRVLDYFVGMYRAMPDFALTGVQLAGSDTTVFIRWRMTGTFDGAAWNGIEPNGASIDLCGMDCMTFVQGRLQHNFVAYDSYTFASQAGAI
jgi:predicted ester cyclase